MRVVNTLRNGIVGMISQLIILVTGFILRAIFIKVLGQEILGLNGLFLDILSILSVTELGIGTAITYSLYKPIFEVDVETITGLMNLYRKAYRLIGSIIFIISLLILPFIQIFIKDFTLDIQYIRFIFILFAFNTTLSYFLGYSRILLFAKQRNYVVLGIDFIAKMTLTITQALILIYTKDFILYLALNIAYTLTTNLIIRYIARKDYPYLNNKSIQVKDHIKSDILRNIKYLSISTIISVGVLGTDRIIISSLVGITILGVYSNYALIIQQVQLLFISLLNGVVASIGNLLAEGDKDKIQRIYNVYHFAYFLIASFTSIALYVLLTPFIKNIWLSPEFEISSILVAVIVFNSYLHFMRQPVWQIQSTAGIFKHYIPFSIIEFVLNLVISIYGAIYWGMLGVFIGTTIAYMVSWIGQAWILNKYVIHASIVRYYLKQIEFIGLMLIELLFILWFIPYIDLNNAVLNFISHGFIIFVVTSIIHIALYHRTEEFKYLKTQILDKLLKRLKRS